MRNQLTFMATVVAAVLAVGSAAPMQAQARKAAASRDLTGRWTLTTSADGPHGAVSMEFELKQNGRKVAGRLVPPHGGEIALEGEFDAGTLSLSSSSGEGLTMKATLKSDGTLAGYLSSERGDMTWTATRVESQGRL